MARRATADFTDGPVPGTRAPVGQYALVAYVDLTVAQHVTDTDGTYGPLPATSLSLAMTTERALEQAEVERLEARNAALVARNTQRAIEAEQRAVELGSHYRFAEAYRVARDAARVRRQLLEGLEVVEVRHAARAPRVKKQELVVLD